MAGFNIQQVDVPGLLAMYTGVKQQGLENQYRAQQIERERRKGLQEDLVRETYKRVFAGEAPAASASKPSPTAPASAPAAAPTSPIESPEYTADIERFMPGNAPGTLASEQVPPAAIPPGAPQALVDPAHLPPRTDGMTINHEALRDLYAIDPKGAAEIQKMVYDMDEATAKRIKERGVGMATVAGALIDVPQAQRGQALQQMAPQLLALGFTPEQLQQTDLSDQGLNNYYRAGMSMEQIIGEKKSERDFGLRQDQFGETQRHNRASESVSAGNLNLAKQRESRVTKWGPQAIIVGGAAAPRTNTDDLDY